MTVLVIIFRTATFVGDIQHFNELARLESFTRQSFAVTWCSVTIRFENLIDRKKSNHRRVAIRLLALNETS